MAKLSTSDLLNLLVDLSGSDAEECWRQKSVKTLREHWLGEKVIDTEFIHTLAQLLRLLEQNLGHGSLKLYLGLLWFALLSLGSGSRCSLLVLFLLQLFELLFRHLFSVLCFLCLCCSFAFE